jgi:RNA polymerase sigma factor (sigma-70 family)
MPERRHESIVGTTFTWQRGGWKRRWRVVNRLDRVRPGSGGSAPARPVGQHSYLDWEALYLDNVGRIYRLMYEKVGNRADAEDLTEEVFLAALRPLRLSATVGEARSYLLATARTVLAAHWRRTLGRQLTALDDDDTVQSVFVGGGDNGRARARAEQILAALPDRYRRVLELRFLGACTVKEAAAELGVTVQYAKVLQHRALRQAAKVAEMTAT